MIIQKGEIWFRWCKYGIYNLFNLPFNPLSLSPVLATLNPLENLLQETLRAIHYHGAKMKQIKLENIEIFKSFSGLEL